MMYELPTSLKTACINGDLSHAKSLYIDLVDANASVKATTLSQMTALSTKNSQPSILSFCFSEGFTLDPDNVNDPVIYAACDSGSIAIFSVLLGNGMDVDQYLEVGESPLVSACCAGHVELAKYLLDEGANPNTGYASGEYEALVWATIGSNASLDMVELLLTQGTVVKRTGALIAAAEHGNLVAVLRLLEHGEQTGDLDLEETKEYGAWDHRKLDSKGTALYAAAANGHLEIVNVLIRNGADPKFRDRKGRSVTDIAEESGHEDIARRLSQSIAGS